MPHFDEHEKQAAHNGRLLSFFNSQKEQKLFSDWYVTVAFYSAVHMVEAILFLNKKDLAWTLKDKTRTRVYFKCSHSEDGARSQGCHSEHEFRLRMLKENRPVFGDMYQAFVNLYEKSRLARYSCYLDRPNDFDKADSWINAVRRAFSDYKKGVASAATVPLPPAKL